MHTSEQYFKFHGAEIIMDAIFLTLTLKILQMQNVKKFKWRWLFARCQCDVVRQVVGAIKSEVSLGHESPGEHVSCAKRC